VNEGQWADVAEWLEGEKVCFGAYVKTGIASHARLQINDGNTISVSAFHTGSGNFEFLSVIHTMSAASTILSPRVEVVSNGTAYFGPFVSILSDVAPTRFIPCPKAYGDLTFSVRGIPTVEDGAWSRLLARPALHRR